MARRCRRLTDALLIAVGLLLAVAVAVDVGRRNALDQRMRVDRHALRAYLRPQVADPQLMTIELQGRRDLVCVATHGRPRRRHRRGRRVCVHVVHTSTDAWRVVGDRRAGRPWTTQGVLR